MKPDTSKTLTVHWKSNSSPKNPQNIVLVAHYHPCCNRSLKHRGIDPYPIASRQMLESDDEVDDYRFTYMYYYTWQQLIRDEKMMLADVPHITVTDRRSGKEWITRLSELAEEYRPLTAHMPEKYARDLRAAVDLPTCDAPFDFISQVPTTSILTDAG